MSDLADSGSGGAAENTGDPPNENTGTSARTNQVDDDVDEVTEAGVATGGDKIDNRRTALIFSENGIEHLRHYGDFLKSCCFRVIESPLPENTADLSNAFPADLAATAQQVILVVQCTANYNLIMEDYLNAMKIRLNDKVDQFLLFCRISGIKADSNTTPVAREMDLAHKFSQNAFQFHNIIVGYYANSTINSESLFRKLQENQAEKWLTVGIYEILRSLHEFPDLTTHEPSHRRQFLRDVMCLIQRRHGIDAFFVVDPDLKKHAPIIYANKRKSKNVATGIENVASKNPRALVIVNSKQTPYKACKAIETDWRNLDLLFASLRYEVKVIHTNAHSTMAVENAVRDFANDKHHGDSCVVIVLSDSKLSGACVNQLYRSLAKGESIQWKPRLVIIQQWRSRETADGFASDGFACKLTSDLAEVAKKLKEELKEALGTSKQPRNLGTMQPSKLHTHSGMLFCHSTTDNSEANGSPFIAALCKIFNQNGSQEDVVSMIPLINEHPEMQNVGTVPQWCNQMTKLFFIADTGDIVGPSENDTVTQGTNQELGGSESSGHTKPHGNMGPISAECIGDAIIFTEGQFDEAPIYQMFLEFVGFSVYSEPIDNDITKLCDLIESRINPIQSCGGSRLALVLVARKFSQDSLFKDILSMFSKLNRQSSSLLIFLEVQHQDDLVAPDSMDSPLKVIDENLPQKFSVVYHRGVKNQVEEFFKILLEGTDFDLAGCSMIGFDFSSASNVQTYQNKLGFVYRSTDSNPDWRGFTWLMSHYDFNSLATDVFERARTNRTEQKKLKQDSYPPRSGEVPKKKAHIIHNVIFDNKGYNRFESLLDCQKLQVSLKNLGYEVSTCSNLVAEDLLNEVKRFANSDGHGDSLVLVVMSHGKMGHIFGTASKLVSEADILQEMNCQKLAQCKQKLIVFQACRSEQTEDVKTEVINMKNYPNMIIAHSTSAGQKSYRQIGHGSKFIQSLCKILDMYAKQLDAVTLSTGVNYLTTYCYNGDKLQLPCWIVNTKQRFYLGCHGRAEGVESTAAGADDGFQPAQLELEKLALVNQVEGQSTAAGVQVND